MTSQFIMNQLNNYIMIQNPKKLRSSHQHSPKGTTIFNQDDLQSRIQYMARDTLTKMEEITKKYEAMNNYDIKKAP